VHHCCQQRTVRTLFVCTIMSDWATVADLILDSVPSTNYWYAVSASGYALHERAQALIIHGSPDWQRVNQPCHRLRSLLSANMPPLSVPAQERPFSFQPPPSCFHIGSPLGDPSQGTATATRRRSAHRMRWQQRRARNR
jgi:hypothetical protein